MVSEKIKNLKDRYKNGHDNIGKDLIGTCLKECILYRRGTAYFSGSALMAWADAMNHVINDNVKIEIMCSPVVSDRHLIEILKNNVTEDQRKKTIQKLVDNIVLTAVGFEMNNERRDFRSQLLAYLIATKRLEFRFAIPKNYVFPEEKLDDRNLYHVKVGYFVIDDESIVAFEGSVNESDSAHQYNTESAQVFKSWMAEDAKRTKALVDDIDLDWSKGNPFIEVFELSGDAIEIIKRFSPGERPRTQKSIISPSIKTNSQPNKEGLRTYQENALNAWKEKGYKGILAMATGTGKTRTAIEGLTRFIDKTNRGLGVITVPYQALAKQWIEELGNRGLASIAVFESQDGWERGVENIIQSHIVPGNDLIKLPILVCVNKTFREQKFQRILNRLDGRAGQRMLIVDECHHFNKSAQINYLPKSFDFRMGLSATPYESDETRYLENYFEDIVFEFKLQQAIQEGYLCQYSYHPILIEFTEEEAAKYVETLKKVKNDSEIAEYGELDRILETLVGKLTKLEEVLKSNKSKVFSLFYCGEGYVQFEDGSRMKQIDSLTKLLQRLNWRVGRITSGESPNERKGTINSLKMGNIDAIASIRILDEGIDIPDCRQAYILASQRSERQGIQRRGRILRKSAGKDIARLYDFIIIGPKLTNQELNKLYNREMKRARLFSEDAINRNECLLILNEI
jgi:superfamily II DNA or RNA helicase